MSNNVTNYNKTVREFEERYPDRIIRYDDISHRLQNRCLMGHYDTGSNDGLHECLSRIERTGTLRLF